MRAVQLSNLIRSIYQHFKVVLVKQEVELDYNAAKRKKIQRNNCKILLKMGNNWRDLLLNDGANWLAIFISSLQIIWAGISLIFALFARFCLKSQGYNSSGFLKATNITFRIRFVW